MNTIRDFLFSGNLEGLVSILSDHPESASEAISLPDNPAKAYPLHRIWDAVSAGHLPEETGVQIAKLFMSSGGNVNSESQSGKDSPLTTACSLGCDMLAFLHPEQGARIDHKVCHGAQRCIGPPGAAGQLPAQLAGENQELVQLFKINR